MAENLFSKTIISQRQKIAIAIIADRRQLCHTATDRLSHFIKRNKRPEKVACEVRIKGLEPPRLSAPDPKSGVATNYTISALVRVQR